MSFNLTNAVLSAMSAGGQPASTQTPPASHPPTNGGAGAGGASAGGAQPPPTGENTQHGKDEKPEGISWKEFAIGLTACFLLGTVIIFCVFSRYRKEDIAHTGISISAAWILFWLLAAYIAAGFQRVGPTEVAVKEILWGLWFQIVHPGPTIVLSGISKLHRFLQTIFTIKIGGPEKSGVKGITIDMKNGTIECDTPLQVYFPNARQSSSGPKNTAGPPLDLKDRTPAWLLVTITARIDPNRVISLLKTGGTLRRVALRIEETTRGVIAQLCNQKPLSETLDSLESMARKILYEIEDLVGDKNPTPLKEIELATNQPKARERNNPSAISWGIDVLRVQLETPRLTADLQTAIDVAQQATQTAEKKKREAEGEEADLAAKGRGNASARKDWMLAEAAGMTQQAEVCKEPHGRFVRMLERDETMAEHAKPMIITSGDSWDAAIAKTKLIWDAVQDEKIQPTTTTERKGGK